MQPDFTYFIPADDSVRRQGSPDEPMLEAAIPQITAPSGSDQAETIFSTGLD
jgi:hypothetical protein